MSWTESKSFVQPCQRALESMHSNVQQDIAVSSLRCFWQSTRGKVEVGLVMLCQHAQADRAELAKYVDNTCTFQIQCNICVHRLSMPQAGLVASVC